MNSTWSPYNQQSFLGSGSPHLPLPPSCDDSLSRYGGGREGNSLHSSSLPGLSSLSSRSNVDSSPLLPNSNYESLISSSMQSPKEPVKFYNDSMFSELCNRKPENQPAMHNFTQIQRSEPQNDSTFPSDNFVGPAPSVGYPPPANTESASPFGVLPHLEVKSPADKIVTDSYIPPVPKPPYNNGPYTDRESSSSKYPPVSSVQSPYSCDTSLSPANVNSLNSSNFSSPTEFYSSPKNNFGAYKSLQSPMPQSPTVAQHSYPSSPFTNIDSGCHISPAPPCSPMNGGTYVNNLNGAPSRNGRKSQHSPTNSAATANMLLYNTSQTQNMSHHRSTSALSRTSDYHSDYNMYSLDPNSPTSYPPVYPTVHRGQMCNGNRPQLSPRGPVNIQNEVHPTYGQPRSVPPPISSPSYLSNKVSPLSSCSSSMRPPVYMSCSSMNAIKTEHYPIPVPSLPNLEADKPYPYSSSDLIEAVNDQEALEMFNSHVDSGAHSHEPTNTISNFLEDELQILEPTSTLSNRQLRSAKTNDCHPPNRMFSHGYGNGNMLQRPISIEHQNGELLSGNPNYSYSSSFPPPVGMRNSTSPKRRGRRGRRRGGNVPSFGTRGRGRGRREFPNIDPILSSQILELDTSQPKVPSLVNYHPQVTEQWKFCDDKRLSTSYFSQPPSDNQKQNKIPKVLSTEEVRQEVMYLTLLPIPPRRVTRNHTKYESPFVACYLKFASERHPCPGEVWPPRAQEEQKSKSKHKKKHGLPGDELKIRFQKVTLDSSRAEWRCLRGSREYPLSVSDDDDDDESASASKSSFEMLSSHKIKQEYDSEAEETGNLNTVTESPSAKRNSVVCNENETGMHLNVTNSETLPAGKVQVKCEKETSEEETKKLVEMPKKAGRKSKKSLSEETEVNVKLENLSAMSTDPQGDSSVSMTKVKAESSGTSKRRLSLRNRGTENAMTEAEPGTVKNEPPDSSSDHFENFDDSDSDPAWFPAAKNPKAGDTVKPVGAAPRKRVHSKGSRKTSSNSNPTTKKKKTPKDTSPKRKAPAKTKTTLVGNKEPIATTSKPKRETSADRFLIAKADINHPTPYIWKVDKKSSMLQRFEVSEQNGVLLYRSSFTYAAGNEISVNNYVTAEVTVKSPETVQYLGPNLSDAAALEFSREMSQPLVKENFDYLKDDFIVYIQSLLSQDVDSSFLKEIKKFNDEYFLTPIKNVDSISEEKKKKFSKNFWEDDLLKSVHGYPHVNIIESAIDTINCHVCSRLKGTKLLQFYGQTYDSTTLGTVVQIPPLKTQFSACDSCSLNVSLYSQLHHHQYNLFSKCRAKANEVKANNNDLESHEDVLKLCLEDTPWIDKMFVEQTKIWHDCNRNS